MTGLFEWKSRIITVPKLAYAGLRFIALHQEERIMSKGKDSKKDIKKKPLLTPKEKKAAKLAKKGDTKTKGIADI